jgi:hypothetical protein
LVLGEVLDRRIETIVRATLVLHRGAVRYLGLAEEVRPCESWLPARMPSKETISEPAARIRGDPG